MHIVKIAALLMLVPLAFAACGGGDDGPASGQPSAQPAARTAAPASKPEATRAPSPPLPPRESTPVPVQKQPTPAPTSNTDPYVGFPTFPPQAPAASTTAWRVLSARVFYDQGGGGSLSTAITTRLELSDDGTWTFGSSSGAWDVSDITAGDWARWGIESYGPMQKVVLAGWNGGPADGPIEESGGQVDLIWVIYPESPPAISAPGTVWMKFGRA